jgi:hypothetical protein
LEDRKDEDQVKDVEQENEDGKAERNIANDHACSRHTAPVTPTIGVLDLAQCHMAEDCAQHRWDEIQGDDAN